MQPMKRPGLQKQIVIEDIETEGDRQLKCLLKRQLDTSGNLNDCISKKKSFTEPAVYKPLSEEVAGTQSLTNFIEKEQQNDSLDKLRRYGLNQQQIDLYLQAENSQNVSSKGRYGLNPTAHAVELDEIREKIASRKKALLKPTQFSGVKAISRHEMELEKAISHDKEKKLTMSSLLVENRAADPSWEDISHPINHLDTILQEAIEKRRIQQQRNGQFVVATCAPRDSTDNMSSDVHVDTCLEDGGRNESVRMAEITETSNQSESEAPGNSTVNTGDESKLSTGHGQNSDSAQNDSSCSTTLPIQEKPKDDCGRDVLQGRVTPIPKDVILRYKLSVEQIREMDRFKNFESGIPNKTLYVKNLASTVTESDLVSLFHRYQPSDKHPIVYRLMTGRMRGQAFITFHDEAVASEALDLVNGYHFKGKPVIIQFGKNKS